MLRDKCYRSPCIIIVAHSQIDKILVLVCGRLKRKRVQATHTYLPLYPEKMNVLINGYVYRMKLS